MRGATAEEPDGGIGIGNLYREYTDLGGSCVEGNEARVKPGPIGGGVELP